MNHGFLPLFVFDGPKRPDFKRGKKINKSANKLVTGMKAIIEAFGFEHRTVRIPTQFTSMFYSQDAGGRLLEKQKQNLLG
jgi:hypothetical protein